jgi:predicted MFS family arabinose efflux permease
MRSDQARLYPRTTLSLLTGLNLLNYVDRYVLFAVQPLIQAEFHRSDAEFGFLTTAFFICYMVSAPVIGFLADRFPRKWIIVGGAVIWSAATLLTAVTFDFRALLLRHTLVGIGEASFVTIAPAYIADLFAESKRGRLLAVFYIAIGVGSAAGYMIGGYFGHLYGWRTPFYIAAVPGFLLAVAMAFMPEPKRGANDSLAETRERSTLLGLWSNGAFWTATLGMAMITFAMGGMSVWMPTFLSRMRGISLDRANLVFGAITLFNGIVATLIGGWLGDRALRRMSGGYYLISGAAVLVAVPFVALAVFSNGPLMFPAILVGEFFLFLNTGPLNAAVVDSVSARIRATAIAVNVFTIHLLGDAVSPTLIGYVSDRTSLQTGFIAAIVAVAIAAIILLYGIRFAPSIHIGSADQQRAGASV